MKIGIIASTAILLATATVPNALAFSVTQNNTSQDGISVNIKQINELSKQDLLNPEATPSQILAQTVAAVVSHDPAGPNGNFIEVLNASDVLKYFYPKYTAEQLRGATITPKQAVEWLHTKGYTASIIDRPLTTTEIKARLDKSEPIITVFDNANADSWLWKNYAGVLYAHDDVETGTAEGKLHASFIKTVNFGEAIVNDGQEAQEIKFPELQNSTDPNQAAAQYKWVSTITGIKRDPSWENAQSIKGDKAKGVFASKLTKAGTQSQVDFTDPAITKLLNKYSASAKEHKTKLAAVSLINLYEDAHHQKTVKDLEDFLKITPTTFVTSQQIIDWYKYLGFDFDVYKGRAPMALTKAINDKGRLYLTLFKAQDAKNKEQNTAALGTGYLNDTANGYRPYWSSVKAEDTLSPYYNTPLTAAGLKKQQELAKKFQYTNVQRVKGTWPVEKTTYNEEMTLYNIRLKGTPNDSGITTPPTSSITTPPTNSTIKPNTTASYKDNSNFHVRETQGQEPWCTSYVQASAVNTIGKAPLNQTADKGAITTAKKLMQLSYPGTSDSDLSKMNGKTVQEALKNLEKNYQTTATIEERTLSFAEVKKEIDAGGIVSMDGYDIDSTDKPGTGENLGHEVAIVGYVTPTSGTQTPYFVVWNPWWNSTFYLSANAKTFNLGGVKYKWTRTWHNWRKTSPASGSVQNIDPKIADKKVASIPNPMDLKNNTKVALNSEITGTFKTDLQVFNKKQDLLSQNVAQYGSPQSILDVFKTGNSYWYAYRNDNKMIQLGINQAATVEENRSNNGAGRFTNDFKSLSSLQIELVKSGAVGIPLSGITAIAAMVGAGQITKGVIKAVGGVLALFGIKASAADFAQNIGKYSRTINSLNQDFYDACKKQ
ncbi:C47 family peptidase [Lactococcus petauri]|uniref:C47 family peptidase n=1 Tax=Lactococcus petauri TaxID=1940789 RepID=UPI0025507C11|nr:C47 family peptidase [Lactococcus petauri]